MKIIQYLNKPEYIFRPSQLCRRMWQTLERENSEYEIVTLPWKTEIRVRPDEAIGRSIVTTGVYDLSVTEVLWRLIDQGETAVDVGANIGYMTSVMARRVGETGRVFSYEPHPEIYEELCENKRIWKEACGWHQIQTQNIALSNTSGMGVLTMPSHFKENRGVASLSDEKHLEGRGRGCQCQVILAELDDLMDGESPVSVIKLDVEGHELKVLQGAERVVTHYVRDIVFEEHSAYPSEVTSFLEDRGFTVIRVHKGIWGPGFELPAGEARGSVLPWDPPSYLATKDPLRAVKRMHKRGWQVFANNQRRLDA
ncbi:MAG TPA: FkbM family methyltransferase [Pyrinomonadaceae bacterium]|nr:FkbM family methyltransferase [Pyrinomonadaceae bacterium]